VPLLASSPPAPLGPTELVIGGHQVHAASPGPHASHLPCSSPPSVDLHHGGHDPEVARAGNLGGKPSVVGSALSSCEAFWSLLYFSGTR
jgi:hypothetical protein